MQKKIYLKFNFENREYTLNRSPSQYCVRILMRLSPAHKSRACPTVDETSYQLWGALKVKLNQYYYKTSYIYKLNKSYIKFMCII